MYSCVSCGLTSYRCIEEDFARTERDGFNETERECCFNLQAVAFGSLTCCEDVGTDFLLCHTFGGNDVGVILTPQEKCDDFF